MNTEHISPPSSITRRDFLKRSSAGLVGASLLSGLHRPSPAPAIIDAAPTELVFSFGPDDSGTLSPLIDAFNEAHKGQIHVTWREMPRASDAYYRRLTSDFIAEAAEIDVIGGDVVWTAEFAHRGWIRDLSSRFYDTYDRDDFLKAALDSVSYRFRIWGVPWFTDVGMLFYREDLLEMNGFSAPPRTWDELKQMAAQITNDTMTPYGFVFQGAEYEGGVANACEYIWNAGGRVMTSRLQIASVPGENVLDPNVVNVNSPNAARGLDIARSMVDEGVTPQAVSTFREQECWKIFLAGDAVFMRNWPFVFGLLDDPARSQIEPEQVKVAPLSAASEQHRPFSCLGGWNLMINDTISRRKRDAAWTFITYLTAPRQQRDRALSGGFLPTLKTLYETPSIIGALPVLAFGKDAIANARARPISPFYSQLSPRIARAFTRTLRGELTGRAAVSKLDDELKTILRKNR